MVLLKRNKVELVPPPDPADFKGEDPEVFYMAATGEIFNDYESYASRISFYNQPIFQDELTAKSGLTFFQAVQSEREEAIKLHKRFPEALKSPVLKAVQFIITGRLDNLVDLVFDRFKDRYFSGEAIFVDLQGDKYYARVIDVYPARSLTKWHTQRVEQEAAEKGIPFEPPHPHTIVHKLGSILDRDIHEVSKIDDPDDYIYSVNLIDESGQFTGSIMEVRSKQLSRDRLTFSKSILKKYLRECVVRDSAVASPWVVRHGLAHRYGIAVAPSQEIVAKNNIIKEGKLSKRKKVTDEEQADTSSPAPGTSKKRKTKGDPDVSVTPTTAVETLSTATGKAEEKDKKKPIKFPIEDLEVDPVSERELKAKIAGEQPRRRDRPPPTTDLGMDKPTFDALLISYHFLQAFGKSLVLSPFNFDDFEGALRHSTTDVPCTLTAEIYASLINIVVRNGGHVKEPQPMAAPAASTRSAVNGKAAANKKKPIIDDESEEEEEEIDEEEESGDELDSREPTPAEAAQEQDEVGEDGEEQGEEDEGEEEGSEKRNDAEFEIVQAASTLGKGWDKKILRQDDGRRGWTDSLCGILAKRATKDTMPRMIAVLSQLVGKEHPESVVDGAFPAATYSTTGERFTILSLQDKLAALQFLCDVAVMTKPIKSFFDECEINLTELRKERVELGRQRKKIAEERAAEEKKREEEGGVANGAEEGEAGGAEPAGDGDGDVEMNGASESRRSSASKGHRRGEDTVTPDASMSAINGEDAEDDEHGSDSERDELESSPEADDVMANASDSDSSDTAASAAARRSLGSRQQALREKTLQRKAEEAARQASLAKQREEQKARNAENKRIHAERARWEAEEERIAAREHAIDLEFRRYYLAPRLRPLGKDRFHDRYWWLDGIGNQVLHNQGTNQPTMPYGTGRLFVQGCSEEDWATACQDRSLKAMFKRRKEEHGSVILEHNQWAVYDQPEQIEQLISWLRIKGNREAVLKRQLIMFRDYLGPGMQKRLDDLNNSAKEQETRRSGRSKADATGPNRYLAWSNTQTRS